MRIAWTVTAVGLAACGSPGGPQFAGEGGTYDPDAGLALGAGDASAPAALDAHIEQDHVTVEIVTLSCSGSCADVQAVATGGYPPYRFAWDDGSTSPQRRVCPTSSTSYQVQVSDTGLTGELARAAETVDVPLTADVIACPDGGMRDAGAAADADAADAGGSCVDPGDAAWSGCVTATVGSLAQSSGFGAWCASTPSGGTPGTWTVCLPRALLAGQTYTLRVTYQIQGLTGPVPQSSVHGSPAGCAQGEEILPLQTWPVGSPFTGTFSQSACVTADARYPQLLVNTVQQTFSSIQDTLTTFEVCTGCSGDP